MVSHNGPERFVCHECGKTFGRKDSLGKHIKRHTGKTSKETWTCHICGKIFTIKVMIWHFLNIYNENYSFAVN